MKAASDKQSRFAQRIRRALMEEVGRTQEYGSVVCAHETPHPYRCQDCEEALSEVLAHDDASWWIKRRRWNEYRYLREALGVDVIDEALP